VLQHLEKSSADTAEAMTAARDSLKTLPDEQAQSIDRLKEMNDKLQAALKVTGAMSAVARRQLALIEEEQGRQKQEREKKPKIILLSGRLDLKSESTERPWIESSGPNYITYHLRVVNGGTLSPKDSSLRFSILDSDQARVSLTCQSQPCFESSEVLTGPREYFLALPAISPHNFIPVSVTVTFPPGRAPFDFYIYWLQPDLPDEFVGRLRVNPPKP